MRTNPTDRLERLLDEMEALKVAYDELWVVAQTVLSTEALATLPMAPPLAAFAAECERRKLTYGRNRSNRERLRRMRLLAKETGADKPTHEAIANATLARADLQIGDLLDESPSEIEAKR